jgi:hypothetical protein
MPRRVLRRICFVCWVLAIFWRSQHMCLFTEYEEVFEGKVVNTSAVFKKCD